MSQTVRIINGIVVDADSSFPADLLIRDGKIEAVSAPGMKGEADRTIDASGRYLLPGAVDEHTHMMDPGITEREEFETGTAAAAYGGVTTVVDHHRTVPAVYEISSLEEKIEYLKEKAVVDFGLKGGISPDNTDRLEAMWNRGITGFKTFTCNLHGVKAMYPGILKRAFAEVKRWNGTVLIHCEDDSICQINEQQLRAAGRTDFASQNAWRSALAEEVAVEAVIAVAKETGARVVIAHVSQAKLLKRIREAYEEGAEIYAETCPHYLYLTSRDVEKNGPWMKFTPPPRDEKNLEEMWSLYNLGYVSVIGSDHCPYPKSDKLPGEKNIWDAPNGIPGVETSLRIMLNAVNEGKTTLNQVVRTMCENPAKLEGLYPKKGNLRPGADGDVVIVDMEKEEKIQNDRVISKCRWSPYDGRTLKGAPETVLVRGQIVVDHYHVVGRPGMGRFIERVSTGGLR